MDTEKRDVGLPEEERQPTSNEWTKLPLGERLRLGALPIVDVELPSCQSCGHRLDYVVRVAPELFIYRLGYTESDAELPAQLPVHRETHFYCGRCGQPLEPEFTEFWDEHVR